MYSANLIGKQMDTEFGLYLPEYSIPAPEVQTNYKEIPFRDGAIDKTSPDGVVHYKDREWDLTFKKTGATVSASDLAALSMSVMNAIHGKAGEIIFDDDPNYKWVGRVFVTSVDCENNGLLIVNIHMITHPYKYSLADIVVVDEIQTTSDEYEGSIVSLTGGIGKSIAELLVSFSPIQDLHGYANPWPGGGGVNKFAISDAVGVTVASATYGLSIDLDTEKETIRIHGTPTWSEGNSYTFRTIATKNGYWGHASVEHDYSGYKAFTEVLSKTSNVSSAGAFYVLDASVISISQLTVTDANAIDVTYRLSLNPDTKPTSWTPYSNICPISGLTGLSVYVSPTQDPDDATVYNVDWTTQAGTVYGGTVDVVTGALTVDRASVDLGTLTWRKGTEHKFYATTTGVVVYKPYTPQMLCDTYKFAGARSASPWYGDENELTCYYVGTSIVRELYINDPAYTDVTEFQTAMSGVQLVYELATPITYQLSAQEVEALVGTNNVWSTGDSVSVTLSTMDKVTLVNHGKPMNPKINVVSEGSISLLFEIDGTRYTVALSAGEYTLPDLILFDGGTDVYEAGEGTITYTYPEVSL